MFRTRSASSGLSLRRIAVGLATALLLGSGVSAAADRASGDTPNTDPSSPPSTQQAAGPEDPEAAGQRPVSGKNLQAGPPFTKTGDVWQVDRTTVTLRNTVTDPDGDRPTLTFEVWTTDANGQPKTKVQLRDDKHPNSHGVLVSDPVASGGTAERTVKYGDLDPGQTYMFHTNAYDGSLYEIPWSEWATFTIRPMAVNIHLPEPDRSFPALDQDTHQEPLQIAQPNMQVVPPTIPPLPRQLKGKGWQCGELPKQSGIQPCARLVPNDGKEVRDALKKEARASAHLLDWCATYTDSRIKRFEACISGFRYEYQGIVIDGNGKPTGEVVTAYWAVGQQFKLANNSATIQQEILLVPLGIDEKFGSVTLNVEFDCLPADKCSNGTQSWNGALVWLPGDLHSATGTISHNWNAVNTSDKLDLSTKITAYAPKANPFATRWQADDAQIRCDVIRTTTPGCVFHKYKPTWVMNFKKVPAPVAHAWLIQSKLPNHPGSKAHGKPVVFLPTTPSKNEFNRDPDKNRDVMCPKNSDGTSWAAKHGNPDATILDANDRVSCDEYSYASSYNSGGMPSSMKGLNEVPSGDACVQTVATRVGAGEWRLRDDWRLSAPTWNEVCGRSAMSSWLNSTSMGGAFSGGFAGKYRLLDKDEYWVDFPEFRHCDTSTARVLCTVPKP